jgi:methylmalonyl-CoA mutase
MASALGSGWVAEAVAATWAARLGNLARRVEPLTGVSEFPNLAEPPPAVAATLDGGGPAEDPLPARPADGSFPLRRLAAPFEALRDAADAAPERPRIFLANLGPLATYTARAGYARNLFEAGGIAAVGEDGYEAADDVAAAFAASGACLAVICSSDAVYADRAEATARALREAGATRVYLAGNPGDRREAYEAAGVDEFVHVGCDVLAALHRAHDALTSDPSVRPTEVAP